MALAPDAVGGPPPGGPQPGTPPIGSSPATMPTANLGVQAKAVQGVAMILDLMGMAVSQVGAATPLGQDLAKCIQTLGKHVKPGDVSPAAKTNQMAELQQKQMAMAPMMAALRASGAAPGGGPGMAPGAAPPGAPPGGGMPPRPPMPPAG